RGRNLRPRQGQAGRARDAQGAGRPGRALRRALPAAVPGRAGRGAVRGRGGAFQRRGREHPVGLIFRTGRRGYSKKGAVVRPGEGPAYTFEMTPSLAGVWTLLSMVLLAAAIGAVALLYDALGRQFSGGPAGILLW